MKRIRTLTIGALATLALLIVTGVDAAKAADDYFKDKVIEIILPNSPTARMSSISGVSRTRSASNAGQAAIPIR